MTLKSKQRYFGVRADSGACRGYIYEVYGAQAQACLKELCDKDSSLPVGGWPISSPRVQEKCTCWFNNQGRASLDCTVRASAWNYKALLTWVGSFRGLCAESSCIIKDFSNYFYGQSTVDKLHFILALDLHQVTAGPFGEDHGICVDLHDSLKAAHNIN